MSEALLQITDLSVSYFNNPALRHISFSVKPGQIVGLVGESGSGKSTFAHSVLGALPKGASIDGGFVVFSGKDLRELSTQEWRQIHGAHIGAVFQDPFSMFSPVRTIGAQFIEAILAHEETSKDQAQARTLAALNSVGLEDPERVFASYAFELSGGMCQRAAIALATVMNPELLIADEPTSALDVTVQVQVMEEFLRLRAEQSMAMVVISHDLRVIAHLADVIYVMKEGSIVEKGYCEELLSNPQHPYTKSLIDAVSRFSSEEKE